MEPSQSATGEMEAAVPVAEVLLRELRILLQRPETPLEIIEAAIHVADSPSRCLRVIFQPTGAPAADHWTPVVKGSNLLIELVAAIRARDWQKVVVLEHNIRS